MPEIFVTTESNVRTLLLNRPEKRNALNHELIAGMKSALAAAEEDESLRAVIIRGAGQDFCSGADLGVLRKISENTFEENVADATNLAELFLFIRKVRLPVIAAVHGHALAGGCGLATACDLVLATRFARFGYPEVKIGFVPAMVTAILRRNLGEKRAFELIALGAEISATEAASLGLINRAVVPSEFQTEVELFASRLAKLSASAISLSKSLLYKTDGL